MSNNAEKLFYRNKTTSIYETRDTVADVTTGEILRQEKTSKRRTSSEPDYIKVYYKVMLSLNGIDSLSLDFILALSTCIGFANKDDGPILFYNNKTQRRQIGEICHISDNMVSRYIKKATDLGVLFKTADKGTYEVNPWMIAKGKWEHIQELQTTFDYINGKWERVIHEEETDE